MTNEENTLQMDGTVSVQMLAERIDRVDLQLAQMQQRSRMCWRLVFLAAGIAAGGGLVALSDDLIFRVRLYFSVLQSYKNGSDVVLYNFWTVNDVLVLAVLVLAILLALCVYGIWKMRGK